MIYIRAAAINERESVSRHAMHLEANCKPKLAPDSNLQQQPRAGKLQQWRDR